MTIEDKLMIIENNNCEDPFIYIEEENLDKETCIEIMKKFNESNKVYEGIIGSGVDKNIKNTTDLKITGVKEFEIYDNLLFKTINKGIHKYYENLSNKIFPNFNFFNIKSLKDTGYQIQKYDKNNGIYQWHNDYTILNSKSSRILTFIWYLNDVDEGGETCFIFGKIKPKQGKLLIFPSTWNYPHKGNIPVSNDKYIITGWIYSSI